MDFHGIHLPDKNEPTVPGKKLSEGLNAKVKFSTDYSTGYLNNLLQSDF